MEQKSASASEREHFPGLDPDIIHYLRENTPKVLLRPDVDVRRARLADVIAAQIVPRLQTLHHEIRAESRAAGLPSAAEIAEFGTLVMEPDISRAGAYFDSMRAKGHSLDTLFVNFLEPTARHLGELWDHDHCDFVDVTIGVAHMQELLSVFGSAANIPARDTHHRVLLLTTPEEKHLFGVDVVASFMRESGWEVTVKTNLSIKDSAAAAAQEWFGVVGLTLSNDKNLEVAAKVIESVKKASLNRSVAVMVGGPVFTKEPELAVQSGADAAAADAPTAVILAKKLLLAGLSRA